jgi:hypothetical protein
MSDHDPDPDEFGDSYVSIFPVFKVNVPMPPDTAVPGSYDSHTNTPLPSAEQA